MNIYPAMKAPTDASRVRVRASSRSCAERPFPMEILMLTATALRTMRAALDWSMRDLASAAGVALGTVLKIEQGGAVTPAIERRVRAAFATRGVSVRMTAGSATVRIRKVPPPVKAGVPPELLGLAYVTFRLRKDGTHRVLFQVPTRLRPHGWPPTRPLPVTYRRQGDLSDMGEVAAIKADARRLTGQLEKARTPSLKASGDASHGI